MLFPLKCNFSFEIKVTVFRPGRPLLQGTLFKHFTGQSYAGLMRSPMVVNGAYREVSVH